jgi:hypothetical protein
MVLNCQSSSPACQATGQSRWSSKRPRDVVVLWAELNVPSIDLAVIALAQRERIDRQSSIGRWPSAKLKFAYSERIRGMGDRQGYRRGCVDGA